MLTVRKIAIGAGGAALATALTLGATGMASAATTSPTPSPSSSSSTPAPSQDGTGGTGTDQGPGHRGFRGPGFGDVAALASKLGVDETTLTQAMQTVRDALRAQHDQANGTKPDPATMESNLAAELAKALGMDQAKVQDALQQVHADEQAQRAADLKARLDAAVKDGTLTQAEADGALKAVQKGVIGGMHR